MAQYTPKTTPNHNPPSLSVYDIVYRYCTLYPCYYIRNRIRYRIRYHRGRPGPSVNSREQPRTESMRRLKNIVTIIVLHLHDIVHDIVYDIVYNIIFADIKLMMLLVQDCVCVVAQGFVVLKQQTRACSTRGPIGTCKLS